MVESRVGWTAAVFRAGRAWLAWTLLAASVAAQPAEAPGLVVTVDAPPSLDEAAAQVRGLDWYALRYDLARAGLDAPPALRVVLLDEARARALALPPWVVGRAFGPTYVEVVPSRTGRFPYGSLDAVVRHEAAHAALAATAGDRPLPRWFHEGVATSIEGGWGGFDQVRLTLAALTAPELDTVQQLFAAGAQEQSSLAYLLAATVVDDLRSRAGPDVPGAIARRVAEGRPFDEAFAEMTGVTPDEASRRAWSAFRWYTPLLATSASGSAVWAGMLVLAVAAYLARRARRRARRRAWDEEERRLAAVTARDGLEDGVEDEHADQAHDGDDRLHDGPRLERLGEREVEVLLEDPEAAVVDVRQRQAAGADGQHQEVGVDTLPRHERRDEAGRGESGDGGRADAHAHQDGHRPGQDERRRGE